MLFAGKTLGEKHPLRLGHAGVVLLHNRLHDAVEDDRDSQETFRDAYRPLEKTLPGCQAGGELDL